MRGGDQCPGADASDSLERRTVSRRAPAAEQARSEGALVAASRNGKQVYRGKRSGVAGASEELLFTFARGHDILNEGLDIRADQVAHAGNAGDDGAAREFPGHRREPTG